MKRFLMVGPRLELSGENEEFVEAFLEFSEHHRAAPPQVWGCRRAKHAVSMMGGGSGKAGECAALDGSEE